MRDASTRDVTAELIAQLTAADRLCDAIDRAAGIQVEIENPLDPLAVLLHAACDLREAHRTLRELCAQYDTVSVLPTRVGQH